MSTFYTHALCQACASFVKYVAFIYVYASLYCVRFFLSLLSFVQQNYALQTKMEINTYMCTGTRTAMMTLMLQTSDTYDIYMSVCVCVRFLHNTRVKKGNERKNVTKMRKQREKYQNLLNRHFLRSFISFCGTRNE